MMHTPCAYTEIGKDRAGEPVYGVRAPEEKYREGDRVPVMTSGGKTEYVVLGPPAPEAVQARNNKGGTIFTIAKGGHKEADPGPGSDKKPVERKPQKPVDHFITQKAPSVARRDAERDEAAIGEEQYWLAESDEGRKFQKRIIQYGEHEGKSGLYGPYNEKLKPGWTMVWASPGKTRAIYLKEPTQRAEPYEPDDVALSLGQKEWHDKPYVPKNTGAKPVKGWPRGDNTSKQEKWTPPSKEDREEYAARDPLRNYTLPPPMPKRLSKSRSKLKKHVPDDVDLLAGGDYGRADVVSKEEHDADPVNKMNAAMTAAGRNGASPEAIKAIYDRYQKQIEAAKKKPRREHESWYGRIASLNERARYYLSEASPEQVKGQPIQTREHTKNVKSKPRLALEIGKRLVTGKGALGYCPKCGLHIVDESRHTRCRGV